MANACMFKNKMKKGEASRRMQGIIWLIFKKTKRNKEKGPFYFFIFKESVFKYYYSLRNLCGGGKCACCEGKKSKWWDPCILSCVAVSEWAVGVVFSFSCFGYASCISISISPLSKKRQLGNWRWRFLVQQIALRMYSFFLYHLARYSFFFCPFDFPFPFFIVLIKGRISSMWCVSQYFFNFVLMLAGLF